MKFRHVEQARIHSCKAAIARGFAGAAVLATGLALVSGAVAAQNTVKDTFNGTVYMTEKKTVCAGSEFIGLKIRKLDSSSVQFWDDRDYAVKAAFAEAFGRRNSRKVDTSLVPETLRYGQVKVLGSDPTATSIFFYKGSTPGTAEARAVFPETGSKTVMVSAYSYVDGWQAPWGLRILEVGTEGVVVTTNKDALTSKQPKDMKTVRYGESLVCEDYGITTTVVFGKGPDLWTAVARITQDLNRPDELKK